MVGWRAAIRLLAAAAAAAAGVAVVAAAVVWHHPTIDCLAVNQFRSSECFVICTLVDRVGEGRKGRGV